MAITPTRGRLLVKPVDTNETLAGGRIVLPEGTRTHWSMGQYEIVAVGDAPYCDDDECERPHVRFFDANVHEVDSRIQEGAWVLTRPRTAIDAGERDRFFVSVEDVIGVFG